MAIQTSILILFIFWVIREVRAISALTALWQHKEYRLDRMLSHLRMPTARRLIAIPIAKIVLVFLLQIWTPYVIIILLSLYAFESLLLIHEFSHRRVRRPELTKNAIGLFFFSFFSVLVLGGTVLLITGNPIYLLILDIISPVIVTVFIFCLWPVVYILRRNIARDAIRKRNSLPNLQVIGITGSYGKSGTKQALATILQAEDTISTPGNVNSEIGVAQFLSDNLREGISRAVLEMGAYRVGEIARMTSIARPSIGVITAVAAQHVSLFGSREMVAKAKYELIESLPPEGTAVFNADNPVVLALAQKTHHCRVVTYSAKNTSADYFATNVSSSTKGVQATIHTPNNTFSIQLPLLGEHVIENTLAAVACADTLNISSDVIQNRLKHIPQQPRTMERVPLSDGTLLIDDSYSANPEGVEAAARVLSQFSDKHIIAIMTPMIELGEEGFASHERAGEALGSAADIILYTDNDYADAIQKGINNSESESELYVKSERELIRSVKRHRGSNTVILLEGRVPRVLWEYLRNTTSSASHSSVHCKKMAIAAELAPNTFSQDARTAFALLFKNRMLSSGSRTAQLEETFRRRLGAPHATALTSGRHAIELLLRSADLPSNSEILLQAYTCVSVPGPIVWAGHTPVYVDIKEGTFTMDPDDLRKKISPKTKAIIIQHTFGIPAPIDELLSIAREHDLLVIEDCAHAIGATFHRQEIGTFGDAAIFSFGRDKAISSTFGGMLVVNEPKRFPHLEEEIQEINTKKVSKLWVIQQLLHPVLFVWIIRPLYFRLAIGKILLVAFQKIGILSKAVTQKERAGKRPPFPKALLPDALATMALSQYRHISEWNRRRNEHAKNYRLNITSQNISHPSVPEGVHPAFLRYPILSSEADRIRQTARSQKILLGNWYDCVIAPSNINIKMINYIEGSCPVAEKTAKQSLNLPTNPTLKDDQRDCIIEFIRNRTS